MKIKGLTIDLTLYSFIFLLIFPIVVLVLWSFAKAWPWPYLVPEELSFRGLESLTRPGGELHNILICSICLSLCVTVITLAISIPAAKAMGVYNFRGKRFVKMLILAPIIVPTVSVSMGIHVIFMKIGLANSFIGVVLVHLLPCLPYGVRILADVFEIIGEKYELQGKVLGANPLKIFLHITLPLIMPGVLSAGSLVFIVSFSQYFLTFLIGGGSIKTLPLVMFPYIQGGDRTMAASYSLVFLIVSLLILFLFEKTVKSHYKVENHFYL